MSSILDTCFVGPWEQKRNFSWSTIDHVNINGYVNHLNNKTKCTHIYPPIREPSEDEEAYPEPRFKQTSIKSASSSSSSSSRNQSDKDNNESNQRQTIKLKKKPSYSDLNSLKNSRSSNRVSSSTLRNKKGSNSMSSLNKFDQINNRIDMELNQLRSNKKAYMTSSTNKEELDKREISQSNQTNKPTEIYPFKSDTIFGDNLSNYNPSTLYRMKKLQNSDQLNRRQFHSNLIATLDTNCDSARVFDRVNRASKKCACCTRLDNQMRSDFAKNLVNKSSSDNCSCSEVDSESSDVSLNEVFRKHNPIMVQRVKSVALVRNKNIEFTNHEMYPLHIGNPVKSSNNLKDKEKTSIHKINKCNNESKLVALKQFCSASIGVNRSKSHLKANNHSEPSHENSKQRQNSLVKNNNIELEIIPDSDNSYSTSARSKIVTPNIPSTPNRNSSSYLRQRLPPANNATFYGSSINNTRLHIQNLQVKYPETIAINGKSFAANNGANIDFSVNNTFQASKKSSSPVDKRSASAQSEIRDIQLKFNQLTKIGVK